MKRRWIIMLAVISLLLGFAVGGNTEVFAERTVSGQDTISKNDADEILESEGNSFDSADRISVNTRYRMNVATAGSWYYYAFSLNSPGVVSLSFSYSEQRYNSDYWTINLFSSENRSNELKNWKLNGWNTSYKTCNIGLPAGVYYVRITAGYEHTTSPLSFTVNYSKSDYWEAERNESFSEANVISVNRDYYGTTKTAGDWDNYLFTIPEDGVVSLSFEHAKQTYNDGYWDVKLFSSNNKNNELSNWDIGGWDTKTKTYNIGLPKGIYYIRIMSDSYLSESDYKFNVNYTRSNTWEKERNESYSEANVISVNTEYKGTIRSGGDWDCYKFVLSQSGNVAITFKHLTMNNDGTYWSLKPVDNNNTYKDYISVKIGGWDTVTTTQAVSLPAGTYNIRIISAEYMDTSDYAFTVSFSTGSPSSSPSSASQNESVDGFVSRMYTVALERNAEAAGLNDWSGQLRNKQSDGATLARGFICSNEFKSKNLSDEAYVIVLYRTFFNREPDAGGKANWINELASGSSREKVLAGFVNSQEFANLCDKYGIARGTMEEDGSNIYNAGVRDFVCRNYEAVLGRRGETLGVEDWAHRINVRQTTALNVAMAFFHSEEFLNKGTSNSEFVEILYRTFLDRPSEASGKAYWVGKLNSGVSRDEVMSGFAYSQEFYNIMAKYGL